jgi:hypothetical protein
MEQASQANREIIDQGNDSIGPMFLRLKTSTMDFPTIVEELKHLDQSPVEYWYAIGSRLQKIHNARLYRNFGYSSFTDFCMRAFGYSRQHCYKLMKVVQFIENRWDQANSYEQRMMVNRLFHLGFTKLYILNSLPTDKLEQLLVEGLALSENGGSERRLKLEAATVSELKRAFASEVKKKGIIPSPVKFDKTNIHQTTIIKMQAQSILQLVEKFKCDNNNELVGHLQVIEQYAANIIYGIEALVGNTELEYGLQSLNDTKS